MYEEKEGKNASKKKKTFFNISFCKSAQNYIETCNKKSCYYHLVSVPYRVECQSVEFRIKSYLAVVFVAIHSVYSRYIEG